MFTFQLPFFEITSMRTHKTETGKSPLHALNKKKNYSRKMYFFLNAKSYELCT